MRAYDASPESRLSVASLSFARRAGSIRCGAPLNAYGTVLKWRVPGVGSHRPGLPSERHQGNQACQRAQGPSESPHVQVFIHLPRLQGLEGPFEGQGEQMR